MKHLPPVKRILIPYSIKQAMRMLPTYIPVYYSSMFYHAPSFHRLSVRSRSWRICTTHSLSLSLLLHQPLPAPRRSQTLPSGTSHLKTLFIHHLRLCPCARAATAHRVRNQQCALRRAGLEGKVASKGGFGSWEVMTKICWACIPLPATVDEDG